MIPADDSLEAKESRRQARRVELLGEGPVEDGARLVQLMRESGTGEGKLEIARAVLLRAEAEGRRATAEEVFAECANEPARVFQGTLDKMRNIIDTGYWDGSEDIVPLVLVEDRIAQTPPALPRDAQGWTPGERDEAVEVFARVLDENRRLKAQLAEQQYAPPAPNVQAGVSAPAFVPNPSTRQAGPTRPTPPGTPGMPSAPHVTRPPNRPGNQPRR